MENIRDLIVDEIPHLRRYAFALLRDWDAADDLVQDCLTRAIDRIHLWRPGSNMRMWLFAIMHNQHVNAARRRANRPDSVALEPSHEDLQATVPGQAAHLEIQDTAAALQQLPDEQRQVVLMVALEGMSYAETAEILDVPEGTVMSRLNRGRQRLREILDNQGGQTLRRVK